MKTLTWGELKAFANSLPEEHMNTTVYVDVVCDEPLMPATYAERTEFDVYVNYDDQDDRGTLEDLREAHGPHVDIRNYKISREKGFPFISLDFYESPEK